MTMTLTAPTCLIPEDFEALHNRATRESEAVRFVDDIELALPGRDMPWARYYSVMGLNDIAKHAGRTEAEILTLLASYPDRAVVEWVAQHNDATVEALRLLATYPDQQIRCTVARHENTTEDILDYLSQNDSMRVRKTVASTPVELPFFLQDRLARDYHWQVMISCAERRGMDPALLTHLTTSEFAAVVRAAIENPGLPLETAKGLLDTALAKDRAPDWLPTLLACGPRYGDEAFTNKIADSAKKFPKVWASILSDEKTPVNVLIAAGKRRSTLNVGSATALAHNPNTPEETIIRLAKDRRASVLTAVAGAKNVTADVLRDLLGHSDETVGLAALRNPRLPADAISVSLSGPRRHAAAENPSIDHTILEAWVSEIVMVEGATEQRSFTQGRSSRWVSRHTYSDRLLRTIFANPACPASAWETAMGANSTFAIRSVVASIEACPPHLLEKACLSEQKFVRDAATGNRNCPEEGKVAAALMGNA